MHAVKISDRVKESREGSMAGLGGSKPRGRVGMKASTGCANPLLKAGYLNKTSY